MKSVSLFLMLLLTCLGGGVRADEPAGSLSQELLRAYPYRVQLTALPLTPYPTVAIYSQTGSNFRTRKPSDAELRGLAEALAEVRADRAALWIWELPAHAQLLVLGRPDVQKLDIPWEPNATTPDFALSASGVQGAGNRFELRVPLVTLAR